MEGAMFLVKVELGSWTWRILRGEGEEDDCVKQYLRRGLDM